MLVLAFAAFLSARSAWAQAPTFTYLSSFTDVGRPTGLALETFNGVTYLYVSDHDGGRVFRYDLRDNSRVQIASPGTGNGQFVWPDMIAIEPNTHDLYIADRRIHRITRLTRDGQFVMKFGDTGTETNRFGHPGAGSAPGQFNQPIGIVIDAQGNLYTTEHENHRVQKLRVTQGAGGAWNVEVLRTWGSGGGSPGQFNTPYGIAIDSAGTVWVADGFNSRLQKFTQNGDLLGQISVRGPSEPHLVNTWVHFDTAGDIWVGVTSDPNPNIGGVLANQRIEKFSPSGASLGKWGTYGSAPGEFRLPFGIVIDPATNRAYVSDYDNNRVQVFSLGTPSTPPPPPPPPPPTAPASSARLVNLSSRQRIAAGDPSGATAGFVVTGSTQRQILVRAVGPGLSGFGVGDALANPRLQVFDSNSRLVAENDDWSGSATIAASTSVGAFALANGSRDAALVATLGAGAYTAVATTAAGSGIVLVEVYDVAASTTPATERFINLSTRGFADVGEGQLVAGFVVTGDSPKRMLIRGIGPGLGAFGVSGTLPDPMLRLFASGASEPLYQNDNWETAQPVTPGQTIASGAEISAAATAAGAFALSPGGRDAAFLVTLAPGSYTAIVRGANNMSGNALMEVFEVP
ncbi:MAG: hypothetical protein V4773_02080 [Verrucomicrobiota bacterium]